MIKYIVQAMCLCLLIVPFSGLTQIYTYTNNTGGAPASVASGASGSNLARVNGANAPATPCGSGFSSTNFTNTTTYNSTLAAIEFTITPAGGYEATYTGIVAGQRRSGTGPASIRYAYSTDGGSTWIDEGANQAPNSGSCGATANLTWDFADFTLNTPVTFRIYGFNASGTGGTHQILNLTLNGDVHIQTDFYGCTDPLACNYDPTANIENGSCLYVLGCTDPLACNYAGPNVCNDFSCTYPGCTNPAACNYQPAAGCDNGTCCLGQCEMLTVTGGTFPQEISWTLEDPLGNIIASGGAPYTGMICITPGCGYKFNMYDSFGGGWNGGIYTFTNNLGQVDATGTLSSGSYGFAFMTLGTGIIGGCTDPGANNYNPLATCDDGSCVTCPAGYLLFYLNFFDSYGDGWNGGQMVISNSLGGIMFIGTLSDGLSGTQTVCLPAGCFTITVTGGSFPTEIAWQLAATNGTLLLSGGAPANGIGFSVGGANCDIPGCTNPACNNFNPFATTDNGTCACPPANDNCGNAQALTCGSSVTGTFLYANSDQSFITGNCGQNIPYGGVWYQFIGTGDQVTFSTCGTTVDTQIHAFTGTCGTLNCIGVNDDFVGCVGFASQLTVNTTNGTIYHILVTPDHVSQITSQFQLDVYCSPCGSPAPNDDCSGALEVLSGIPFTQDYCCTNPDNSNCLGLQTGYGLWYYINSSETGCGCANTILFQAQNVSGSNVGITIYRDSGNLGCANLVPIGCAPLATQLATGSISTFGPIQCNTNYYFLVYTTDPVNCGEITFTATRGYLGCTDTSPCAVNYNACANIDNGSCIYNCAPANDNCANATLLPCNTTLPNETTGGSTPDGTNACGVSDNGVWYELPTGNGDIYTVSTCGSAIDSRIQILKGTCGSFTCTASEASDALTCGTLNQDDASISFVSEVGATYYAFVSSQGFDGPFTISLTCVTTVLGCMNPVACNYNPAANWDSGNCDYFSCTCQGGPGTPLIMNMTDSFGDGWNGGFYLITNSNGEVVAAGTCNEGDYVVDNDNNVGCESAFDLLCLENGCYNITVGGGAFPQSAGWNLADQNGNILASGNGAANVNFSVGGTCGCTSPAACNYNPAATLDNGSCCFALCANLTITTGSFPQEIFWTLVDENGNVALQGGAPFNQDVCLEQCTYYFSAYDSFGDGWNGASFTFTVNGSVLLTGNPTGSFQQFTLVSPVCGCTNPAACNYDVTKAIDDGSCCYDNCVSLLLTDAFGDGWNGGSYAITDANTGFLISTGTLANGYFQLIKLCLPSGCYIITSGGGQYPQSLGWSIVGANETLSGVGNTTQNFSVGSSNCIEGCTEPAACNYNPMAGLSVCGICEYVTCKGCTYNCADNYNPAATIDDGSCYGCEPACPADLNQDGVINVTDLLIFMGSFGTFC